MSPARYFFPSKRFSHFILTMGKSSFGKLFFNSNKCFLYFGRFFHPRNLCTSQRTPQLRISAPALQFFLLRLYSRARVKKRLQLDNNIYVVELFKRFESESKPAKIFPIASEVIALLRVSLISLVNPSGPRIR